MIKFKTGADSDIVYSLDNGRVTNTRGVLVTTGFDLDTLMEAVSNSGWVIVGGCEVEQSSIDIKSILNDHTQF